LPDVTSSSSLPPSAPSLAPVSAGKAGHQDSLRARGLGCRRGDRLLFEGLDIDLGPGEALWLTGPNGAGKTSLLRILAGLLSVTSGEITLGEGEPGEHTLFLGLRDALKPSLTVGEALLLHTAMLTGHAPSTAVVGAALARFGLARLAAMPNGWLSTGQRRRVALARHSLAGAYRPLWLLDEPANGLDSHAEGLLAGMVAEHRAAGGMVIVASHQTLGWPAMRELAMGGAA
jgi:heme exporter protein A